MPITSEQRESLDAIVSSLGKKYDGASVQLGPTTVAVESIQTGLLSLDVALGCGGIPKGRIVELYGNESSGKTTLCLQIAASCQKQGGIVAFIDAEHAMDLNWASRIGVNSSELLLSQPSCGEEAFHLAEALVSSGIANLIIIDSVAALLPKKELEGNIDDAAGIGSQARMMSQCLRKLTHVTQQSQSAIIFINQLRDKIGGFSMFGTPESTPGGRALKFYASCRIETKRGATIKSGEKPIGAECKITIRKNKVAPPFMVTTTPIYFGCPEQSKYKQSPVPICGFDYVSSTFDGGKDAGVITNRGSNYYIGDKKIGAGADSTINALRNDPVLCLEIHSLVHQQLKSRIARSEQSLESAAEDLSGELDAE